MDIARIKVQGVDIFVRRSGTDLVAYMARLEDASTRMVNLKPVFDAFEPIWHQQEARIFTSEGIPAWPRLSPAYADRKRREVGRLPILVYTGRLRSSLVGRSKDSIYEATPRTLKMGTRVPYSTYHSEGTSRMPARPHVELLPETFRELADLATDYISQPLNQRD